MFTSEVSISISQFNKSTEKYPFNMLRLITIINENYDATIEPKSQFYIKVTCFESQKKASIHTQLMRFNSGHRRALLKPKQT